MTRAKNRRKRRVRDDQPESEKVILSTGVTQDKEITAILKRMSANDSFSNPIARMGYGTPNISEGTEYPLTRLTNNYQLLNSLYRNSWISRNVIDMIPEDMTRNWIRLRSQMPPDELAKIDRMWKARRLKHQILHGLKWGRLYGGAAGIIMIEGHEDILDEPLDLDDVMPGSFKTLMVIDRWVGCYPSEELVEDLNSLEFGLPKFYEVKMENGSAERVHHSRVIRFMGRQLPYWEQLAEVSWGASEIEIIFEELKKRDNTSWNILQLTFLANLRVFKMADMEQVMSMMDAQSQEQLFNVMQAQNWMMSNSSMQVIGAGDDFQTSQYSFTGINDIYQSFMMDVSGATKIPVTKLFGRSPSGMNATGESDMDNYYDTVQQAQESTLAPVIDKILPVMCMSELGYVPDDLDYDFNPIQEPSDKDQADLVEQKGNLLNSLFTSGILGRKTVLLELKQMSDSTGMFTNITDEDIQGADNDVTGGEEIPDDAFSTIMGAQTPNREGIPERHQASDAKANSVIGWLRRSHRNH